MRDTIVYNSLEDMYKGLEQIDEDVIQVGRGMWSGR